MNVVRVLRGGFADATCRATYLDRSARLVRNRLPLRYINCVAPSPRLKQAIA
jgi:hypothetical protein